MAIKNYTSQKSPAETIGEIQQLLAGHDAKNISIDYEGTVPVALTFRMMVGDTIVPFRITANTKGMLQAMKDDKDVPKSKCNMDQARRTAWKNNYEWLQTTMARIASNQAEIQQLLLGFAVTPTGETLYEAAKSNQMLLTEGK